MMDRRRPRQPNGARKAKPEEFRPWRLVTATRVFALAAALGLSAAHGVVPRVAVAYLALCALSAVMAIPVPDSAWRRVGPLVEGALIVFVLASLAVRPASLLVVLLVPPFVAGVQSGSRWALLTVGMESTAAITASWTSLQQPYPSMTANEYAPWLVVAFGLGFLGSWMRRTTGDRLDEQEVYESAHRLLGQLRTVSRRLSSGLDTTTLAHHMLARTVDALCAARASVLIRSDESTLTALASTQNEFAEVLETDAAVSACFKGRRVTSTRQPADEPSLAVTTALPLRVGRRVIGVVVADGPAAVDRRTARVLQRDLDEQSLRLESALLFDDVRSTATLEERHRLAREIHDGIAQEIASLGYLVDDLAAANAASPGAQQTARQLRGELSRVVNELRLSIFDLRSNINSHSGLGSALSDYAREVGKRGGMTVHLALSENTQRLHLTVESELLRIAQEAITNARKHSQANNLWVTLNTESPVIALRIEDDGIGAAQLRDNHYGLRMMQERAERIGGEVAITPRPRGGTSVMVTVWPRTHTTLGEQHGHFSLAR